MHLGSIKTFNHATWVFSNAAALREKDNTRATACLSLAGICLTVRTGSSQIASKVGRGLGRFAVFIMINYYIQADYF